MVERICVFCDGSNFYNLCRENFGQTAVDLGRFAQALVGNRALIRTYYYNSPLGIDAPEEDRKAQERFYGKLERIPYFEVRLGRLVRRTATCRSCGTEHVRWTEKGVDMRIGVDMLSGASKNLYDTAILVSGDGDLCEAVQAVKDLGRHVEVAAFRFGQSRQLSKAADVVHLLDETVMAPLFLPARSVGSYAARASS